MKHIIFGGFDYAVLYEMNQDAIMTGVDYFIETDESLIGTSYLGKPIKGLNALKEEKLDDILILIGSIPYRTELALKLKMMGLIENKHYIWGIAFNGDEKCPRLWKHVEWSDAENNAGNLKATAEGEYFFARLKIAASMVNWKKYNIVIDLGAANERLKELLPVSADYVPVDYVRYSDETVVCDIDNYQFPDEKYAGDNTCIFAVGVIQYCSDWKWFLKKCASFCNCVVLGHDDFARISREYRRTHWTRYNALFDHEIIRYMQKLGFALTDSVDFRLKSTLYKFEKEKRI